MLQWMLGASWDNHSATPFARALEAWGTDTNGWTEFFAKNACFEIHADPQCLVEWTEFGIVLGFCSRVRVWENQN